MPIYRIKTNIIEYYRETDIKAKNADEAEEKYFKMIENGKIQVVNQDYGLVEIKEVE